MTDDFSAILKFSKRGTNNLPELSQNMNLVRAQSLLKAVAEELKLPLMQIARSAELTAMNCGALDDTLESICLSAGSAIELVDSYLLGLTLAERQQSLAVEPVAIGSVLYDVAGKLDSAAGRYNVEIIVELAPACQPVMASPEALRAALFSLGMAFIESLPAEAAAQKSCLTLAAHRTGTGLAAGVYSPLISVSSEQLHKAGTLNSFIRQPLSQFSHGSSAGIFVARAILESMSARLRTAHHHKQAGLAAVLQPSYQLKLV